jgi:hypothetical protein
MRAKAKRFYDLTSAWRHGGPFPFMESWEIMLTTSESFEFLEKWSNRKLPTIATKPRKNIPDLVGENAPIVTTRFKSVVEAMAPGAAEFRPFSLRWEDHSPVPGEWHLCNLLQRIDCLDFESMGLERPRREKVEAEMKYTRTSPMTEEEYWHREGMGGWVPRLQIYVNPEAVGDAQIWRPRWDPEHIHVTDAMLKAFKKAGVRGLHKERLGTRDEPFPGLSTVRESPLQQS